jgi:hypothetical protein
MAGILRSSTRFLLALGLVGCGAEHGKHDHAQPSLGHIHSASLGAELTVTHRAVNDGRWDDPLTWKTNTVPNDGAVVLIPEGIRVTLRSVEQTRLAFLRIGGTLNVAPDADTKLMVETILVLPTGALRVGSESAPVERGRTAEIVFLDSGSDVMPTAADPDALRRGLVAMGEVRVYGREKSSFRTLAQAALKGSTELSFDEAPVGWRAGDKLVVPSTHFHKDDPLHNELVTITSVNGAQVGISEALRYVHRAPEPVKVHVANVSRNVVFRSESGATERRGHVMLMNCGASTVSGALLESLGRSDKTRVTDDPAFDGSGHLIAGSGTNPRGRYPLHFHQCGLDQRAASVRGSVVHDTPGWGMVNHSSRVNFEDNVVYDFAGAGFVSEEGDELGAFTRNIAVGGRGNGEFELRRTYLQDADRMKVADFAFHGDGFWFQSPSVEVVGNVAAGNKGAGFLYHAVGLNKRGGVGMPDPYLRELGLDGILGNVRRWRNTNHVLIVDLPIRKFESNSAYGNFIGLKPRYVQSPNKVAFRRFDALNDLTGERSIEGQIKGTVNPEMYPTQVVKRCSFWNNAVGVQPTYIHNLKFVDVFIGASDPEWTLDEAALLDANIWVGWEGYHGSARNMMLGNTVIQGYPIGILTRDADHTTFLPGTTVTYRRNGTNIMFNDDNDVRR